MSFRFKNSFIKCRSLFLALTLYPLSGLCVRSPKRWVFGSLNNGFSGNPKYLFLWVTQNEPDIQSVWITSSYATFQQLRSNGLPVRLRWSFSGIFELLRAGVFVYGNGVSDVSFSASKGAFLLNLWHGVGVKALAHHDRGPEVEKEALRQRRTASWWKRMLYPGAGIYADMFVTTSDFTQQHFINQFSRSVQDSPQLGYPRLDCAFDESLNRLARQHDRRLNFQFKTEDINEVYLYMPTYRDSGREFLSNAIPDPDRLSNILASRKAILYVKLHPRTHGQVPTTSNILTWPEQIDFQPYLSDISSLITDYSSVLYDYIMVAKEPPLLYTFDWEKYQRERTLSEDFESNTAGLRINSFDELCKVIQDGNAATSLPTQIALIREKFWAGSYRPASPEIIRHVADRIGLNVSSAKSFNNKRAN